MHVHVHILCMYTYTYCTSTRTYVYILYMYMHMHIPPLFSAKAISTTASTASFDKNPQSKERGITLDLGNPQIRLSRMYTHLYRLYIVNSSQSVTIQF